MAEMYIANVLRKYIEYIEYTYIMCNLRYCVADSDILAIFFHV